MSNRKKVVIGISGGIDSTAAALLLKEGGYDVFGVTFDFFGEKSLLDGAKKAAEHIGIKHEIIYCQEAFRERVIQPFINGYLNGYTPNPCVICDKQMKFKNLVNYADAHNIFYIATGHYLKIEEKNKEMHLLKSNNQGKDQTYYLYTLNQPTLRRLIFPLGIYETKDTVRQLLIDAHIDIPLHQESQGICFIPDGNYGRFIRKEISSLLPPGRFKESQTGKILGSHRGFYYFTLGQRRKFGVNFKTKYCVVAIHPQTNEVVLGEEKELLTKDIYFKELHFISDKNPINNSSIDFKICRWGYHFEGKLNFKKDGSGLIESSTFVRAPMPGQAIVFYENDRLLGGAIIEYNPTMRKK